MKKNVINWFTLRKSGLSIFISLIATFVLFGIGFIAGMPSYIAIVVLTMTVSVSIFYFLGFILRTILLWNKYRSLLKIYGIISSLLLGVLCAMTVIGSLAMVGVFK